MENTLIYGGIGSRRTPPAVMAEMRRIAGILAKLGYTLRSGAADGADMAFEEGCVAHGGATEIWLPWKGFNGHADTGCYPTDAHFELASKTHPAWEHLTRGPRALHARNMGQVLGRDLATPTQFVLCWTPDGCESEATRKRDTGGTGGAITLASRNGIPVFNLANADALDRLMAQSWAPRRRLHPDGSTPKNKAVFVFGSNLAGRHGAGSALVAREQFGAVYGKGEGPQGQSYAIPTKDGRPNTPDLKDPAATLPVDSIRASINQFIAYARKNPTMDFHVVRLGCDLAKHTNAVIAPLFEDAPANCSFPEPWEPWLGQMKLKEVRTVFPVAESINIWSGARGIGGALTNMSERAREKGLIKHPYPVVINDKKYMDSEAAYQALKIPGDDDYNDGLMIDLIALKLTQNPVLREVIDENGGAEWLRKCSHFVGAKSERAQSWEGQGYGGSRFIRNLVHGYEKVLTGRGPVTRVVHVDDAPYDVYIGRAMPGRNLPGSIWQNRNKLTSEMQRGEAVTLFFEDLKKDPALMAQVPSLKGLTISCWCKGRKERDRLCHGDVLATLADGREWVPPTSVQSSLF